MDSSTQPISPPTRFYKIARFDKIYLYKSATEANVNIDVNDLNTLNFSLSFKDGSYKTDPDPIQNTGNAVLKAGDHNFDGTTHFDAIMGGLDQAYDCKVAVAGQNISIKFKDVNGNEVGGFQGKATDLPSGRTFEADSSRCYWKKAKKDGAVGFQGHGVQVYESSSKTKGSIIVEVENKLDFQLVLDVDGLELWTSAVPITTTGTGFIRPGTYKLDGSTWYATSQELRRTASCRVDVTGDTVSIHFEDINGNAVGMFDGTILNFPLVSSFKGPCQLLPIDGL